MTSVTVVEPVWAADPVPDGGQAHAGAPPGASAQSKAAAVSTGSTWAIQGIDVSSHDHTSGPINWPGVAASGVKFAYVKATEGTTYLNPYFHDDYNQAKAAGILTGAYHWGRPDKGNPVGEADYFIDRAEWINDSRTLIPFLDIEWPWNAWPGKSTGAPKPPLWDCYGLTPAQMVNWISAFVDRVRVRTGRYMMIYTNTYWWNPCTGNSTSFANHPLDLASYTVNPPTALPSGWSRFTLWQYAAGNNSVVGNYDRDTFNGDYAALTQLTGDGTGPAPGPPSTYTPAGPVRVLDTRNGTGLGRSTPLGSGQTLTLPVTGVSGVPASGVTAVVLNVTVAGPTSGGFLTVFPSGRPRPGASNLNFEVGQTVPNLVTVPVIDGKVNFYNPLGTVHVIADLFGYFATGSGSVYTPAGPVRVLDTRDGIGLGRRTPLGSGQTLTLPVTGVSGVPASGVTAVVLNVTVTGPTATGFLAVYPDGQPRPGVSNLNFVAGQTVPNLVTVPVVNGKVNFYNPSGAVNLVADLFGYYTTGSGSVYTPAGPVRVLDTRNGTGLGRSTPLGSGQTLTLPVTSVNRVPASGVTAVVLNVTVTGPTSGGFLAAYPDGQPRPGVSNLNFVAGQTVPNLVTVPVVNGKVNFYNPLGTVHLVADLFGYYIS